MTYTQFAIKHEKCSKEFDKYAVYFQRLAEAVTDLPFDLRKTAKPAGGAGEVTTTGGIAETIDVLTHFRSRLDDEKFKQFAIEFHKLCAAHGL